MLAPLLIALTLIGPPQGHGHGQGLPPGLARKEGGLPPGLARKENLPPGLAKRFGRRLPERPYVALDPRYQDRAWFLIDGRWELRKGFDASVQAEVRDAFRLPAAPPPVPLPRVGINLHVVLFN